MYEVCPYTLLENKEVDAYHTGNVYHHKKQSFISKCVNNGTDTYYNL